ncbi:hypothetical protein B0H10DRAFT_2230344 [Mycena sp. CBHHK59/15]|nr:hypothetical protein B0H10DRAFT_2230344 [Mycena sp. CBHHK59/15]
MSPRRPCYPPSLSTAFLNLPQNLHPVFHGTSLRYALASVSWQIDLLPPQAHVLAHCVLALASSISFRSAILGLSPQPESFDDRAVLPRRRPAWAFGLACAAGVLPQPSEDNAASCFILELLDCSRPWAGAYISHMRTLATTWDDLNVGACRSLWTGFLMVEALSATAMRKPILITQNDQLLMTASEPQSLLQLVDSVQTCGPPASHTIFNIMHPYMYHVTRLARELSETARRHPLSEPALMSFVASLRMLHTVRARVFDTLRLDAPDGVSAKPFFHVSHQARGASGVNICACAHSIIVGYSCLVLALEQEVALRTPTSTVHPTSTSTATRPASSYAVKGDDPDADSWRRARLALLRREVPALARNALEDVAHVLAYLPSLPHLTHLQWSVFQGWGQFCFDCEEGGVSAEECAMITSVLKLIGYSWDLPLSVASDMLIERLEACALAASATPFTAFQGPHP